MDSALKQRLIGAAVLIALAIIFVPMFFSGSAPVQPSDTVNLEIPPPPEREFQTRVLAVDSARPGTSAAPAAGVVTRDTIATVDTGATPRVDIRDQPAPASPAAPVVSKATPAVAASTPAPAPVSEPVVPPAAGIAANGRFFVHLGVYASSKNAADLVASLKQGGYAAMAQSTQFQGKDAQRVRVGPYATRADAEAARIRIKAIKADVPSSVVSNADDQAADAPATAIAPDRAGAWAVQLGAFKTQEDANKLRGRLQGAGFVAFVDKIDASGQTMWRVRAGPETERTAALGLRDRIKDKLKMDGMIVTQP